MRASGMAHAAILSLTLAAGAAPHPWGPATDVGEWGGELPPLPQHSAGNLPHSPMVGNGYLGVMLASNRVGPPLVAPGSTRGPAAAGNTSLSVWLGSNAMWGVYPSTQPSLGPQSKATRRAVGGLTLSGLDHLFAAGAPQLVARQHIAQGRLTTSHSRKGGGGWLNTSTHVSPTKNVVVTDVRWTPPAGALAASRGVVADLKLSLFTFKTFSQCCPPGQHMPATLPTSARVEGTVLAVTREAVPANISTARRVKAALAVAVHVDGGATVTARAAHNVSAEETVAEATATITVSRGEAFHVSIVTAYADNLRCAQSSDCHMTSLSLAKHSASIAVNASAATIINESHSWWEQFWNRSHVWLPTEPAIEALWNGAQYILACSASAAVDPHTPAPGLGGPFVTSDNAGWNGDYTLDYNYEATYYGVYASGHPELAELYWAPILDGMPSARRGAQDRARAHNITCPATALHYNAHIGPWGSGDFDEQWEQRAGQHMMWNGIFGALLFLNDYEYMGASRSSFFTTKTLPLLEGLLDWWACYLVKVPCSLPGTQTCPSGGYRYDDRQDAVNEGSSKMNSQIALAFVARLAEVLRHLPRGLSRATPIAEDIALHLAPFDTATCISPHNQSNNVTIWVTSEHASIRGSSMFSMYPVFPSEFLSTSTATEDELATAQASARVYNNLGGGRPVETFPSTVMAGRGYSDMAWTPQQTLDGMKVYMKSHFGPNLLCDTNGGGIENVGMSRAINEMLVSSPSAKYIQLFPFWPTTTAAGFSGLMVKGGFRIAANFTPGEGVLSPVRLWSMAGANATFLNPWPGHSVSISAIDSDNTHRDVPIERWQATRAGHAFVFSTTPGGDTTYVVSKGSQDGPVAVQAEVACTAYTANCSACMAANDTRRDWASPCVYLSGPSESGARCQPSKWWFPPYNSKAKYPSVHACANCSKETSACPAMPTPPPAPPPPIAVCPTQPLY